MPGYHYEPDLSEATSEDIHEGEPISPAQPLFPLKGVAAVRAEIKPVCIRCHAMGSDLLMRMDDLNSPVADPTFNPKNGHMICDMCWRINDPKGMVE